MRRFILSVFALSVAVNCAYADNANQATIRKTELSVLKTQTLTLATAIHDAITYSPKIQSTQSAVKALIASVEQAGYKPNPQFDVNFNNIAGRSTYQGVSATEYDVNISQMIETAGKRQARIKAAQARVQTEKVNILIHKQDIKYTVEMLYLDMVIANENLKFTRFQENMAKKTLAFISKRVAMAADHETQRSKALFSYEQAVTNRKIAEQKLMQTKQKLALICGYPNTEFESVTHDFLNIGTLPANVDANHLPDIPDLQKFDFLKKEKQAVLVLEKANAVPNPTVTAGIRRFAKTSDEALFFGMAIPLTFHNNNQGNINTAQATLEQVNYDKKQAELATKQMLMETYQALQTTYMRLSDMKTKLIPQATRSFELAKIAYKNDIYTYIEVLDAQNIVFNIKQQYIQLLQQYHTDKIKMNRLTKVVENEV